LAPIVINEIKVIGSRCGPFADALEALAARQVSVTPLIDKVYDLVDGVDGLRHAAQAGAKNRAAAVYLDSTGSPAPWTEAAIYYSIDPDVPDPQRIRDAIEHWNTRTPVRLLPRTGQINYVRFIRADAGRCASSAGMVGGVQFIQAGADCNTGAMIHEIGHAAGLLHEQARHDRDRWVTVLYEYVDRDFSSQFHTGPDIRDDSYYDYDSIMHYSARSASLDGRATIQTVPPGKASKNVANSLFTTARLLSYSGTHCVTSPPGFKWRFTSSKYSFV